MKKYIFLMLLFLCSSCMGETDIQNESVWEMEYFYKNYNIFKIKKMYEVNKDMDPTILNNTEDKCIINYLSPFLKNKKIDYQNYLLSLPVNKTDKYDKLIIDLTIKSAGPLKENWDFMHEYLNQNIKDIERLFEKLNEYSSENIYSFFLVYLMYYEAPYPVLETLYHEEEIKKIEKFEKLKKELPIMRKKFNDLNEWDLKIESEQLSFKEKDHGELNKYFSVDISDSLSLYGTVYNKKDFILELYETTSYYIPPKLLLKESINIYTTKFYTYGPNFFIIKKSGSEFILTKYEYDIKESKLKVLDKVKLENCF